MSAVRKVLLVTHTRRPEAMSAALETCQKLVSAGIVPVMLAADHDELLAFSSEQDNSATNLPDHVQLLERDCALAELEVAMVLGGDGTILKAAEIVREAEVPLVGINLGHVGFLMLGGYAYAIAVTRWGLPAEVALLLSAALPALFGLIVGLPSLRLHGLYLAITTVSILALSRLEKRFSLGVRAVTF